MRPLFEKSDVEARDAVETPADIRYGLDETGFFGADGLEEFLVGGMRLGREQRRRWAGRQCGQ